MHGTHISFIQELSRRDECAWEELDQVYRPLIRKWLHRYGLQPCDVEDLAQEVMAVLVRDIGEFQHNGRVGAFRNWLRTTSVNLTRNYLRNKGIPLATGSSAFHLMLTQLEDESSSLAQQFDRDHDRVIVRRMLRSVSKEFEPITLAIFYTHVVAGKTVAETAEQLNVSAASVHTAKSRVLRRLRSAAPDYLNEVA